ncbi:hypothetical protein K493DRAFT_350551 [Basidiobolus meristosporus CBS 931.73]|uniref:Uncharacterized protein n=1 Tax=Basidiobolus meristosporus CBS 931.73 TaxID=1314790 RepID=A0A1Y1YFE9_9FUNG|nr:hypothetical protein K493DRAFT_350551 [Basidiobolus meristosporus CBS 931.73]|eukprot:ORX96729.1 hypothetical protein K493DRAFT_350551 [Basidiobolus meristosporus CBS 931.73]
MSSDKPSRKRAYPGEPPSSEMENKRHRGSFHALDNAQQPVTEIDHSEAPSPSREKQAQVGSDDKCKCPSGDEDIDNTLEDLQTLAQNLLPETYDIKRKFLDPTIHALFTSMKKELEKKALKILQLTEELEAVKFSPSSLTGKRLLAKCRSLQQENEGLGKRMCQGRVAQYELEISMQRKLIDSLKEKIRGNRTVNANNPNTKSDHWIEHLDTEVESLQSRLLNLQSRADACSNNHPPNTTTEPR